MKLTVSNNDNKKLNELEALVEQRELIPSDTDSKATKDIIWNGKGHKCIKYVRTYFDKEGNEVYTVHRYVDSANGFEVFDDLKEIKQPEPKEK